MKIINDLLNVYKFVVISVVSIEIIIIIISFDSILKLSLCYDSSYASSLIAMLMTILKAIVDRLSLEHRLVLKSTLFRVSLCSSESYR